MIGNASPVGRTGYSVLEEGNLDRQSFCLHITAWRVADRAGDLFPNFFATKREAEAAAERWAAQSLQARHNLP